VRKGGAVQAVVRAFSILDAIAGRSAGISLGDLSRCVGLHKSTTFRVVETMVALG
jgi:DNA-binding IclR family transcriptional regulator